jgi:hypothetical protein
VNRPGPDIVEHNANHEERIIEARGWPLIATWGERDLKSASSTSAKRSPLSPYSGGLSGFGGFGASGPPIRTSTASLFSPLLPLHPIWSSFIIDTIAFAILYRLIYLTLAVPRRFLVEISRMRRGCCLACGYQLGFDFRAGCPECGWRRMQE